jgi:hypothetical protein
MKPVILSEAKELRMENPSAGFNPQDDGPK